MGVRTEDGIEGDKERGGMEKGWGRLTPNPAPGDAARAERDPTVGMTARARPTTQQSQHG